MSQLIHKIIIENGYIAAHDRVWQRLVVYMGNKEALTLELTGMENTTQLIEGLRNLIEGLEKE